MYRIYDDARQPIGGQVLPAIDLDRPGQPGELMEIPQQHARLDRVQRDRARPLPQPELVLERHEPAQVLPAQHGSGRLVKAWA
jgi:hypothetical protein